jgi:hypothetical protein
MTQPQLPGLYVPPAKAERTQCDPPKNSTWRERRDATKAWLADINTQLLIANSPKGLSSR